MNVKPPSSARTRRLPEPTRCAAWSSSSPWSARVVRVELVVAVSSLRLISRSVLPHSRSARAVTAAQRWAAVRVGAAPAGWVRFSSKSSHLDSSSLYRSAEPMLPSRAWTSRSRSSSSSAMKPSMRGFRASPRRSRMSRMRASRAAAARSAVTHARLQAARGWSPSPTVVGRRSNRLTRNAWIWPSVKSSSWASLLAATRSTFRPRAVRTWSSFRKCWLRLLTTILALPSTADSSVCR